MEEHPLAQIPLSEALPYVQKIQHCISWCKRCCCSRNRSNYDIDQGILFEGLDDDDLANEIEKRSNNVSTEAFEEKIARETFSEGKNTDQRIYQDQ